MRSSTFFAVSVLAAADTAYCWGKTCTALALSGGGNKGAWEAGIVYGLMHSGNPSDYEYDVVSGVSAGSINASYIGTWPKGQEVKMSEEMSETWQNITTDQIYKSWTGGWATGILLKPALYNTAPALDTFDEIYNANLGKWDLPTRELIVSAMNVDTGVYTSFDSSTMPWENWGRAVLASASVPFVFPPTTVDGQLYMDGMTAWNTNLASAVQKCYDITGDYSKITLDIANCDYYSLEQLEDTSDNALSNYMRGNNIHAQREHTNDILEFKRAYPQVNYRHYFAPSGKTTSGLSQIDFSNSTTYFMQVMGREDAAAVLSTREGLSFDLLEDYHSDEDIQEQYPWFMDYFHSVKNMLYQQ